MTLYECLYEQQTPESRYQGELMRWHMAAAYLTGWRRWWFILTSEYPRLRKS